MYTQTKAGALCYCASHHTCSPRHQLVHFWSCGFHFSFNTFLPVFVSFLFFLLPLSIPPTPLLSIPFQQSYTFKMMMRPKSLHLPSAPQPTYSTSILQLQQQNVPVSPPSTPLVPNSPESVSSPPLYPSPTSSTVRPTSSTSTTAIKENVQVMVRLRPPSTKERQADEQPCWLVGPEPGMIRTYDDNRRNPGIYQYGKICCITCFKSTYIIYQTPSSVEVTINPCTTLVSGIWSSK